LVLGASASAACRRHGNPSGAVRVPVTNLDSLDYPAHAFGDLSHQRWRIEEAFDCLSYCTPFVCH